MLSGATRAPRQGTVGQGRIEPPDIWPAGCATVPKPLDPVPGQQGVAAGVDAEARRCGRLHLAGGKRTGLGSLAFEAWGAGLSACAWTRI